MHVIQGIFGTVKRVGFCEWNDKLVNYWRVVKWESWLLELPIILIMWPALAKQGTSLSKLVLFYLVAWLNAWGILIPDNCTGKIRHVSHTACSLFHQSRSHDICLFVCSFVLNNWQVVSMGLSNDNGLEVYLQSQNWLHDNLHTQYERHFDILDCLVQSQWNLQQPHLWFPFGSTLECSSVEGQDQQQLILLWRPRQSWDSYCFLWYLLWYSPGTDISHTILSSRVTWQLI